MIFHVKPTPKLGDWKIERKFLWLPLTLNLETRWLEFVYIKYVYEQYLVSYDMGGVTEEGWVAKDFII